MDVCGWSGGRLVSIYATIFLQFYIDFSQVLAFRTYKKSQDDCNISVQVVFSSQKTTCAACLWACVESSDCNPALFILHIGEGEQCR